MNALERKIYNIIAEYPWIRKSVVAVYQKLFSVIPGQVFEPINNLKVIEGCFYGFHDKVPWSHDNNYLLAHRYDKKIFPAEAERLPIEIGLIKNDASFQPITQSNCWNWQQGSMLQWLGKDGLFAFNNYTLHECIQIYNTSGDKIKEINGHMGAAHPDGKKILGFSFGRLSKATDEYGYQHFNSRYVEQNTPIEDGLWSIDIELDKRYLIVSLDELAAKDHNESMVNAYHYVTHTTYNSSGDTYVFLHRWKSITGKLYSRLYIGDSVTHSLRYFPIYDTSHISWDGNDHLFIYGWLHKNMPSYLSLCAKTLVATPVLLTIPNVDGHPQVNENRFAVTDSYPDRSRIQSLYVCNLENNDCYLLQKSKIPFKFRHARRCDFHPRWNRNGTKICFDSAKTGIRSLCILDDYTFTDKRFKRM